MSRSLIPFVSITLLAFAGATLLASETALPLRKAGKWEQKTTMEEGGKKHEQALTICIDADMERNTSLASVAEHKANCSKYDVKSTGSTVVVEATCKMNGRDVQSHTEMSGDFQKSFSVKISSTTSGVQDAQTISIARVIEQQGTFISDSCGDLQAGEAMGPDGKKVFVQ